MSNDFRTLVFWQDTSMVMVSHSIPVTAKGLRAAGDPDGVGSTNVRDVVTRPTIERFEASRLGHVRAREGHNDIPTASASSSTTSNCTALVKSPRFHARAHVA